MEILLDGEVIAVLDQAPYDVLMPVSEELEGRTLVFTARATDSAGQETISNRNDVLVQAAVTPTLPEYAITLPLDGQRSVESSPIKLQVESSLGILPDVENSSGIRSVDFLFDDVKVGTATFPGIEVRDLEGGDQEMFEIWTITTNAPSISHHGDIAGCRRCGVQATMALKRRRRACYESWRTGLPG